MAFSIPEPLVEPTVRGLVGAIDVDGGPTDEQLQVLAAVVHHLWGRDDLDVATLGGLGPDDVAGALDDAVVRRRFHELLVTLESCRHPLTDAQVSSVEAYAAALGVHERDLAIYRTLIDEGAQRAAADFQRFFQDMVVPRSEASLRELPIVTDAPEPELVAQLESLAGMPDGSLGQAFLSFYERNGLELPGTRASGVNHLYVGHDMIHVLAGIEPTGPGEIGLGAFQMGMDDNPVNTFAFLSPLALHESGLSSIDNIEVAEGTLSRPGAIELMAASLTRGARCTADFASVDHFALAHLPLEEVRARFGVTPPVDAADGHHHWPA
jgi:ubiquinone biosynthesis protein Coq4